MKTLLAVAEAASPSGHDLSLAEGASMMSGGMWGVGSWMGGDGGIWVPILLAILVVGFVAWFFKGRGK